MKIFLDFDNTLLHTRHLVDTLCKPYLQEQGIPLEKIEEGFAHFASGVDPSKPAFSIEEYLKIIGAEAEKQQIYADVFHGYFERAKEFLFPGTEDFLTSLADHQVILLTFGNHDFQNLKIKASGIAKYCSEVCITQASKVEEIAKQVDGTETFILVDDHGEYFEPLKKQFGKRVYGVHVLHSKTKRTCSTCQADAHATNFEAVIQLIQNICAA